jgi:hypothetical protein
VKTEALRISYKGNPDKFEEQVNEVIALYLEIGVFEASDYINSDKPTLASDNRKSRFFKFLYTGYVVRLLIDEIYSYPKDVVAEARKRMPYHESRRIADVVALKKNNIENEAYCVYPYNDDNWIQNKNADDYKEPIDLPWQEG